MALREDVNHWIYIRASLRQMKLHSYPFRNVDNTLTLMWTFPFQVTIVLVWISSAVYSIPRLYYINTITMVRHDGEKEIICIPKRTLYDSVTFDLISMVVLFIVPLAAITVLYTIIGIALWRSSRSRIPSSSVSETSSSNNSYAEYDTQTETPGGMRPVQVPTASRSRRRKSVSAGRLWCGGWCVRRAWRRRRSRSSGSRKGRRRRGSSCLYEESSSPHTNLVCYHYSPGGVNGLDRTSSIEDNGNHHRHITSCSHCDCDHHHHHHKAPLGECVEDTGVTTVAHPCLNGSVCSADSSNTRRSSVMLVSSGACNSCSRPSKKRGRRGSFDTTASPEPLVLVKIKKRGPFYNRTEGHSSALLQSSSTATSSFDGCCSSAAAAAVEAENNRTNLYLSECSSGADGHRPSSCPGNQLNQRTTIIDGNISHEQNGTSLLGTGGSRKHGNSPHGVINICSNGGATRLLNDKKLHGSPCACSAGGSAFTNAVPGGALGGASPHGIPGASCSMNRRNYPNSNEIGTPNKPPTARLKRMRVVRMSKYGTRALQSRRRIIRMLIVIVVAFAVCNLPFHARKMWQNYSKSYQGGSTFSSILTPVTFLIMYANSGINPLLYAFMSHKFRSSFKDLLTCKLRRSSRANRRPLARSTHIIPVSTAV